MKHHVEQSCKTSIQTHDEHDVHHEFEMMFYMIVIKALHVPQSTSGYAGPPARVLTNFLEPLSPGPPGYTQPTLATLYTFEDASI